MSRGTFLLILLISMIIGIIVYTGINRNQGDTDIVRELEVQNNSSTNITATIQVLHYKFREGIVVAKLSKVEGFGPDLSLADKAVFYWSLEEQEAFYHFNKATFDLRLINIPEGIQKVQFAYNGNDDCQLNIYAITGGVVTLNQKSIKLDPPFDDRR